MKAEILKMVWKLLRPLIEKMLKEWLQVAIDRIAKFFTELFRKRETHAKGEADAAVSKARESTDPIEIARQEGKAEAWREIADLYKQDIQSLRSELAKIRESIEVSGAARLTDFGASEVPKLASENK